MGILDSMRMNPSLVWLSDMIQLTQADEIRVPTSYPQQVYETKELLASDGSGLVNTVLDFAIACTQVDYSVETSNPNLTNVLNKWLHTINYSLKGTVPVGVKALAKEYGRERWKSSSFLLLRTVWEEVDGYTLPTKLWFVDGEDIIVEEGNDDGVRRLGEEKYSLRISKTKKSNKPHAIPLPSKKDELIFIQKPYSSWNDLYPIPFVIQRGIFRNLKFLELLEKKGDFVVGKALEYLLLLKKGDPTLSATNPDFTYSKEDFQTVKDDLAKFLQERNTTNGVSAYTTGFDTEFEHLIPEYERAIKQELYSPTERKLLAGLGLIDIIQGIASTRKDSILNPKPFISDVETSIVDYKTLLADVMFTIVEKNKIRHKKYFSDKSKPKIHNTPVKQFIDKELRQMMRSVYDRGGLSKQTFIEVVGELDYQVELERRIKERKSGADIELYPPIIQNVERDVSPQELNRPLKKEKKKDVEDENKTGLEKINYVKSLEEAICPECGEEFDFESAMELEIGVLECPHCEGAVNKEDIVYIGKSLVDIDDIPRLNVKNSKTYEKSDYISIHLNEESYKQKITEQSYSYFKLALISKSVKDYIKEDGWKCNDVLNIDSYSGKRTRPVYSKLPTSRIKTEELLVDGFYCLEKDDEKLVVGIRPYMSNFGVAVYSDNSSRDLADVFISGFETHASDNNFLKGEKITPVGKFLTIPETTFKDVKLDKNKKQAIKIGALEFFKKKEIYAQNKLPFKRGLIFAGEPGTGKTLVGKALMKETKNTFIWVTAGDLTTHWGDMDPQAFGRLLGMAKELAPSVLFAEDIDDYLEAKSSVDTIKTQMDGLDSMDGVVTILCTNYPERIPLSLIDRPSRFDDVIMFDLPDEGLRYDILDAHLKKVTIRDRVNVLKKIAKESDGLTGAHLKEVAVYSILLASDAEREEILKEDFNKSLEKIMNTRELIKTLQENKGAEEVQDNKTQLCICSSCGEEFDYLAQPEAGMGWVKCPNCEEAVTQKDLIYEEAPYKNITELPKQVQVLPKSGQKIWLEVFNKSYPKGEDYARKVAWTAVKNVYKKVGDKWVKKK